MARVAAAALCLLLVAFVKTGSCTHCYQCISSNDPSCNDPFRSTKSLKDCSNINEIKDFNIQYVGALDSELTNYAVNSPRYCHKIVTKSGLVIRSCFDGNPNSPNETCARLYRKANDAPNDMSRQLKHCSVCDKENCNGAGAPIASISLALGASILAYFICRQ